MTESLLEASLGEPAGRSGTPSGGGSPELSPDATASRAARPSGLPDKFWDEKTGQVRLDALLKSYLELERRLGTASTRSVPATPDQYKITVKNDLLTPDTDINRRMHAAGFSQEQVQLVYDLAAERLMPMIAELASIFEAESQIERLTQQFGGEERWREIARQIDAWGRARLPARVFEALSTTFEGIVALHRMMEGEEPGLLREGQGGEQGPTEAGLKQLMRDPRYWKHQDPAIVEQIRDGFRRLYHEKG